MATPAPAPQEASATPLTGGGKKGSGKAAPPLQSTRAAAQKAADKTPAKAEQSPAAPLAARPVSLGSPLRLVELRSASPRLPTSELRAPDFAHEAADGSVWRLRAEEIPPLDWSFSVGQEGRVRLDITGESLRLHAQGEIREERLAFHVDPETGRMLREGGFEPLLRLIEELESWEMQGDMLVFSRNDETLCLLERTQRPVSLGTHPDTSRPPRPERSFS